MNNNHGSGGAGSGGAGDPAADSMLTAMERAMKMVAAGCVLGQNARNATHKMLNSFTNQHKLVGKDDEICRTSAIAEAIGHFMADLDGCSVEARRSAEHHIFGVIAARRGWLPPESNSGLIIPD